MRYHLSLYPPAPNDEGAPADHMDLNPEVTQISFSTGLPGGWIGLTVGMRDPARPRFGILPRPIAVKHFYDVVLEIGPRVLWNGRVQKILRSSGGVVGFEAVGYAIGALRDGWYSNRDTTVTTAGQVLRSVISDAAPLLGTNLDPDLFVDSGVPRSYLSCDGLAPADVLQALSSEGSSADSAVGAIYDWACFSIDRFCTFTRRLAPLRWQDAPSGVYGADYWIDFDETVQWVEDSIGTYGSVTVDYTGGTVPRTPVANSATFTDTYGLARAILLKGGQMTDDQANAYRDAWLHLNEVPQTTATITRTAGRGLTLGSGRAECPPHLVRAGQWVQVADQEPLIIGATQYDANTEELQLTLISYPAAFWDAQARLEHITRALELKLNPLTGGSESAAFGALTRYVAGTTAPADMPDSGGIVVVDDRVFVNAGGTTKHLLYD